MIEVGRAEVAERAEAVRFRRALTLLALTLVLPGSAQLVRGNKAVGRAALRIVVLVAAVLIGGRLALGTAGLVRLGFTPWVLVCLQVTAVVLGVCWLGLFVDAWRLGRPPTLLRRHRLVAAGVTCALMAGVGTPAAWGVGVLNAQRELLGQILVPGPVGELWQGRLNVLLLGGDGGPGRTGIRTDSISLASIDVATGRTVLFSLPRNLERAPFPPGTAMAARYPAGYPQFLYGVYTFGAQHPELFGGAANPGALAVEQAVAQTLGVPVHYYALVNLRGFQRLVDAIGGITIRVEKRLPIGGGADLDDVPQPITGWIEPGLQKLDGYHALWYARSRATTTDYDRMARQRCVIGAIVRQADPAALVRNFRALVAAARQTIETDLTTQAVQRLLEAAPRARHTKVMSIQFDRSVIDPANPDIAAIRARVAAAIRKADAPVPPPPAAGPTTKKPKAKRVAGEPVAVDDTCRYR
jgi:polyisoprenyl-teichoic acid--peptidoglycan teichoic acid transferase